MFPGTCPIPWSDFTRATRQNYLFIATSQSEWSNLKNGKVDKNNRSIKFQKYYVLLQLFVQQSLTRTFVVLFSMNVATLALSPL